MKLKEYIEKIAGSGESVIGAAFVAQQVEDDPELKAKAQLLITVEDEFEELLEERGIVR